MQNIQRSGAGKPRSPTCSPVPRNKRATATNGQKEQTRAIKDANVRNNDQRRGDKSGGEGGGRDKSVEYSRVATHSYARA